MAVPEKVGSLTKSSGETGFTGYVRISGGRETLYVLPEPEYRQGSISPWRVGIAGAGPARSVFAQRQPDYWKSNSQHIVYQRNYFAAWA